MKGRSKAGWVCGAAAALLAAGAAAAQTKMIFDSEKGKGGEKEEVVRPPGPDDGLSPTVIGKAGKPTEADLEVVYGEETAGPQGPPPKVQVIVDGSGSMAEMLEEDKTKMYFAKRLLSRYLIEQWKEKAEVSLRVYGARRTKDCSDDYRAVNFRARSLDEIARKVAVIEPTGKTPIAKSIKSAYDDLKTYDGPKRIVLFTDGQETCGGDPCELVKKFEESGVLDMKVYVVAIGMDPNSDEAKGLACLGDVSFADSEADMHEQLGQIQNQMSKSNNLFVDNPDPTASVVVYKIEANGNRIPFKTFTAAFGTAVPPGVYAAEVKVEPPFLFRPFEVPPRRSVTLKVKGKGLIEVRFVKALASVEVLNREDKLV
ncbi:MAG: VWA domain-containing protein, partial [Bdellovibrionales bacterium]|nr:VWA domain-containing protein [Bdellovibrionales bacterium]